MNTEPDSDNSAHDFAGDWPDWANDLVETAVISAEFQGLGTWDIRYHQDEDFHQFWLAPRLEPANSFPQLIEQNPSLDPDELIYAQVYSVDFVELIKAFDTVDAVHVLRPRGDADEYAIEGHYRGHWVSVEFDVRPFADDDKTEAGVSAAATVEALDVAITHLRGWVDLYHSQFDVNPFSSKRAREAHETRKEMVGLDVPRQEAALATLQTLRDRLANREVPDAAST